MGGKGGCAHSSRRTGWVIRRGEGDKNRIPFTQGFIGIHNDLMVVRRTGRKVFVVYPQVEGKCTPGGPALVYFLAKTGRRGFTQQVGQSPGRLVCDDKISAYIQSLCCDHTSRPVMVDIDLDYFLAVVHFPAVRTDPFHQGLSQGANTGADVGHPPAG